MSGLGGISLHLIVKFSQVRGKGYCDYSTVGREVRSQKLPLLLYHMYPDPLASFLKIYPSLPHGAL